MRSPPPPLAPTSLALLALLACALTACDARRHMAAPLADYVSAVEALTVERDDAPDVLARLPRARERRIDIPPGPTLDVRGFLGVHGCGLGEVVGQRNNALGRVMTFSQRALYTLRFLAIAERCIPTVEPPLRDTLQAAVEHKARHLPADVFNAVWAGKEVAILFAPGEVPFDAAAADRAARAASALTDVVGALRRREPADLEAALAPLHDIRVARAGLQRMEHARFALTAVTDRLARAMPDAAGCADLRRVFERHYVARVQPLLAENARTLDPLIAQLRRLYAASTAGLDPPPALAAFVDSHLGDDGLPGRYHAALRAHADGWRRLFAACGQPAPGAP